MFILRIIFNFFIDFIFLNPSITVILISEKDVRMNRIATKTIDTDRLILRRNDPGIS